MLSIIKSIVQKLSYIISPPYCANCRVSTKERTIFCDTCFAKITPVTSIDIKIKNGYMVKIIAISDYKEPLRTLILAKKSSNYLASKQLGQLMWQMTNLKNCDFDHIIPIPLHYLRKIKRGYNQTETMANVISQYSKKPVEHVLKRRKITKYQLNLNKDERSENLKNAFEIKTYNTNKFKDKHILLVDDLYTTGSTVIAASNELIKLTPKSITVVVGCRVV